ncbi:MAG: PSD1 and planctomycete cytochrome C domain-containing protein, partial [Pirellula sp.]
MFRCFLLAILIAASVSSYAQDSVDSPRFETDIRPILREYCLDCHGASDKLEGSLDLRLVRLMLKGGDSGPALVSGNADASLILQRIESEDMPPGTLKVSPAKRAILRTWVNSGAPTHRAEPESIGPGIPLTDAERSYWAYLPLAKPQVHRQIDGDRIRNGIDQLIADAMPQGLGFSSDAPRASLIRRVFLDLIGLPPSKQQFQHWLEHPANDWYEQLIEELLQSPHYGERWARHWLDAAGYADSDGATLADAQRDWAWKYRDYVIKSLNQDKPIDRFIIEQLAGDELAGDKQGDWTDQQIEFLTATGFLRMTADGTASGDNSPEARNKTIADTIQVIGTTLLGSSLQCAQCHDHRYDPLSQEDYFAVRAVLEPALDWQQWKTPNERLISLYTQADRDVSAQIEKEAQAVAAERATKEAQSMKEALDKELMKFEEPLRDTLRIAYETPADKRTDEQKNLLEKNPSVNISPGVLYQYLPAAAEELKKLDAKIAEIRGKKPPETFLQSLTEPAGHLPMTKLFHRGDHNQPTREVAPGKLTVLVPEGAAKSLPADDPEIPTSGRRLAFAKWLTQGDPPNPLFVRSFVNRIWMHHFGKAIVATPGDFGKLGTPPSHPQLLDWLGYEWIEHGWSLKHLHRTIMLSTAYRQTSVRDPGKDSIDSDNRYYWRRDLQRLDAESLRDSILALSGQLKTDLYGVPIALQEDDAGQVRIDPSVPRRSLYAKWRRTQPVAMLQAF